MRKRILNIMLCCVMLVGGVMPTAAFATGSATPDDITGAGTEADPYLIYTAEGLKQFRDKVNSGENSACAKLINDIDLEGSENNRWTPIGTETNPYTGNFYGSDGHTIKGLYVKDEKYAGLFGKVSGGTVKNLAVTGYVHGTKYAGGIVGYANGGSIEGCVNLCHVSASGSEPCAGGIVGYIIGNSATRNCANLKDVSADGSDNCYAGGIAGYMNKMDSSYPEISGSYNIGHITGTAVTAKTGSIAGDAYSGIISNCRWLIGTAEVIARSLGTTDDTMRYAKNKAQFADGTELAPLNGGSTDGPWTKTGYLTAADMTIPLLDWQTAAANHTHNAEGVLGGCTCGKLPADKGATAEAPMRSALSMT